jgi:quercetin dioxygenase-like cupin family protein
MSEPRASFQWYESGKLFGLRYFLPRGASIPMHVHAPDHLHNVIVLAGSVLFMRPDHPAIQLLAGDVWDFDGSKRHELKGQAPYSVILNLFLEGIPEGYDRIPINERQGFI